MWLRRLRWENKTYMASQDSQDDVEEPEKESEGEMDMAKVV
jgi:hypothetical protein